MITNGYMNLIKIIRTAVMRDIRICLTMILLWGVFAFTTTDRYSGSHGPIYGTAVMAPILMVEGPVMVVVAPVVARLL